jgi:hypothetical protein
MAREPNVRAPGNLRERDPKNVPQRAHSELSISSESPPMKVNFVGNRIRESSEASPHFINLPCLGDRESPFGVPNN